MADYLVFDDISGDFIVSDEIQAVVEHHNGSRLLVKGKEEPLFSSLKPRELLRRLTIMRFKRENGESTSHPNSTAPPKARTSSAAAVSGRRNSLDQIIRTVADEQSDAT
jgi:hypothetical protein